MTKMFIRQKYINSSGPKYKLINISDENSENYRKKNNMKKAF